MMSTFLLVDGHFSNVQFYKRSYVLMRSLYIYLIRWTSIDSCTSSMMQRISSTAFIADFKSTFYLNAQSLKY